MISGIAGKADVKPQEILNFAAQLKVFNEQLDANLKLLLARFKELGASWKDQEHQRFAQEFEQTVRQIRRFNTLSEKHHPFLLRKAKRAEDYIRQR